MAVVRDDDGKVAGAVTDSEDILERSSDSRRDTAARGPRLRPLGRKAAAPQPSLKKEKKK